MDFIKGADKIIKDIGYWPSFNNDNITKITIDNSSIDIDIRMEIKPANKMDYFVCITFDNVSCFSITKEYHDNSNSILDLKFINDKEIICDITSSLGLLAHIQASDVSIRRLFITIDVSNINDIEQLHFVLAEELQFPKIYGKNWDAFWDAITGLVPMPKSIVFKGWTEFERRFKHDAIILKDCLLDYKAKCDENFKYIFVN